MADRVSFNDKILAKVSDYAHGLRIFKDLNLIRVKSDNHSLLIMNGHFPVIGSINGKVELVSDEDSVVLENIRGFYIHRNNEFSLVIEDSVENERISEENSAYEG